MEFFYLNRRKKFLWIFDPFFFPLVKFFEGKTIYDCVDFVSAQNKEILHLVKHFEIKLVREADFFFVNSNALRNKHKSIREPDKILPQGFSFDAYQNPKKTEILFPKDKPIIGFVGAVNQRIDFNLMVNLIRRNPEWNFILWGPKQDNTDKDSQLTAKIIRRLKKFNNFITGLTVNKYEVPNIVKQFDIGIIPYDISQDFNKFCYPMKLFEYFYLGKPVVSTPIEELKRFPKYIKIANSIGGWEDSIKFWLKQPPTKSSKKSLKSLAVANSWMNKISIILDIIGLSIQ